MKPLRKRGRPRKYKDPAIKDKFHQQIVIQNETWNKEDNMQCADLIASPLWFIAKKASRRLINDMNNGILSIQPLQEDAKIILAENLSAIRAVQTLILSIENAAKRVENS